MNKYIKQKIIAFVTFIAGLYFFLEYVLPEQIGDFRFGLYHEQIIQGVRIVGVMAIGLGIINILSVHVSAIIKGRKGWGNSIALLLGLLVALIIEAADMYSAETSTAVVQEIAVLGQFYDKVEASERPLEDKEAAIIKARERLVDYSKLIYSEDAVVQAGPSIEMPEPTRQALQEQFAAAVVSAERLANAYAAGAGDNKAVLIEGAKSSIRELSATLRVVRDLNYEQGAAHIWSSFVYNAFFVSLGAAMFSLLAFYIAGAAYRSFRLRSIEAALMMTVAVVVILGQIPHGPAYIYSDLPGVRLWILNNVNVAGMRAIYFGAAIAGLAMATRMWLSIEKSPMATDDSHS